MTIARTDASGGPGLLPEVLQFSSSLASDLPLFREDVLGSLAHVAMLEKVGIVPKPDAAAIVAGLRALWERRAKGELVLPDEEDVHMAVEAELKKTIGAPSDLLHSARSRNDQVATDVRLHVRDRAARLLEALTDFIDELLARASQSSDILLPAYTHRQRAQPISAAYWFASFASGFVRDAETLGFVLAQCRRCPLGVGAISGTSLPIDRHLTATSLGFEGPTLNGLDTVGDRDFALDYLFAASKFMLHASRFSTELIDFSTSEFGFATLSGDISMGSSMMPQKKNPDLFELVRGKSGRAIGNLVGLLTVVKGLPGGYNRDLQEERVPLVETGVLYGSVVSILRLALSRFILNPARARAALDEGFTQATDLAEALVKKGIPFRQAYRLVGTLVRTCQERGLPLSAATVELASSISSALDADALSVLAAPGAVARKKSFGGTSPESVAATVSQLKADTQALRKIATAVPTLDALFERLKGK